MNILLINPRSPFLIEEKVFPPLGILYIGAYLKNNGYNNIHVLDMCDDNIPKNIDFAGEPVPLNKPEILERLDQEMVVNMHHHSSTILTIKRASKYFPTISKILKQHGIPDDFKFLAVAESNLRNVTSPAGAVGFWQIMEKTGKEYGLEINDEVDERLDLELSTHAAARYLKAMHKELGNWTNVAASYNRGINGFKRAQKKQKVTDFYDLRMNNETARYIFRIVALKEIMAKPEKYGFKIYNKHKYKPEKTTSITVDTSISNLIDFAHSFGITYKTLRIHNTWINSTSLPNKNKKIYKFKLPLYKDLEDFKLNTDTLSADSIYILEENLEDNIQDE